MIPLATIDGHAFALTRLILPIRYRLSTPKESADSTAEVYREHAPEDLWKRVAYFTSDTAYALYGRPKWLCLEHGGKGGVWSTFNYNAPPLTAAPRDQTAVQRPITVEIRSPRLVLFECNPPLGRRPASDTAAGEDPLKAGFLCIDVILRPGPGVTAMLEDLLEFNDLVRMLWPLYRKPDKRTRVDEQGKPADQSFTEERYGRVFHEFSRLREGLGASDSLEDVGYIAWWESALRPQVELEGRRFQLLDDTAVKATRHWVRGCALRDERAKIADAVPTTPEGISRQTGWLANTDNRAFVWTYACLPKDSPLGSETRTPKDRPDRIGHWTKFLNIDGLGPYYWCGLDQLSAATSTPFERVWTREHTYYRWAAFGTYYGFTPHSGALLFNESADYLRLDEHFQTLYFDQILLLLHVRTVTFAFSALAGELGGKARDALVKAGGKSDEVIAELRSDFKQLKLSFMSFSALYQFPLLSTQQQSVEMYALARRQMDLDELFHDVEREIDAADRTFAGHREEAVTANIERLTMWGLPVAVMVLILTAATLLLDSDSAHATDWRAWWSVVAQWRPGYALDFAGLVLVLFGVVCPLVLWVMPRILSFVRRKG